MNLTGAKDEMVFVGLDASEFAAAFVDKTHAVDQQVVT